MGEAILQIGAIGQIAVMVDDLGRAIAFYRDVLGLRFLFQAQPGMAFFQVGETRLMLGLAESPEQRQRTSLIYFSTADAEAGERALREHGVEIVGPAHLVARLPGHELWLAFFRDSEGNTMGLMAEKPL